MACVAVGRLVPTSALTGVTTPPIGEAAIAGSDGQAQDGGQGIHSVLHVSTHPTFPLASHCKPI